jgi:UDP-glucose 4-epimerase
MKILVTGSSGHLGEALMRTLENSNHEATGVDLIPGKFTHFVGSVVNRAFVRERVRGTEAILHTATLHKPHVVTHSHQHFIATNITGTLNLLEEAAAQDVRSFIFTSTTSTFGDALTPEPHEPAAWITENVQPIPKNIYGITKTAAEDLCWMVHRNKKLNCLVLKTSRFFPEEDDNPSRREAYSDVNLKANEFLHRRVDVQDVVDAHLLAMERAPLIGFGKYIISAMAPFTAADCPELHRNAPAVVRKYYPEYEELYRQAGWKMFPAIGRVYVNHKAGKEIGWVPKYSFQHLLNCLREGKDYRSPLTRLIGKKGYHSKKFKEGPYPVSE